MAVLLSTRPLGQLGDWLLLSLAPTWLCEEGAEMGNSCPTAPSSLEIISSLALFSFFLTGEKPRSSWLGSLELRSLSPAQKGRRRRPPRRGPATRQELGLPSTHAFCWGPCACPRVGAPVSAPGGASLQGQGNDFAGLSRGSEGAAPRVSSYHHMSYLLSSLRQGQSSVISQSLHPWSQ